MKNIMKCGLVLALGLAVAGCSKESSEGEGSSKGDGGHKKVQLWKNGPYWAETNIGAENPWDFGYYFWWGGTVGYRHVNDAWVASSGSSSNFQFHDSNALTYDKSLAILYREKWITEDGILLPEHDAAHVHWGDMWRMPTRQELNDLERMCDWKWTTMNGADGVLIRGRGDYASASIFLPASGSGLGASLFKDANGDYWSSVPRSEYDAYAWSLNFNSGRRGTDFRSRGNGYPVRPVQGFTK